MRGEIKTAREGYVYTDGRAFGTVVYLRQGDDGTSWHEVPQEDVDMAAEGDYLQALQRFGVTV